MSTVFAALEHRFTIETLDVEAERHLSYVLQDLVVSGAASTAYRLLHIEGWFDLHHGDEVVVKHTTRGHAIAMLLWHVNQEAVRCTRPTAVVLHAAAAVRKGVGVLLPAPMEHGKTTTVTGLLRAGYSYVTDEAVCVDPASLLVTPYPKSLSVDRGSWPLFPDLAPTEVLTDDQWQVPVSTFADVSGPTSAMRLVVSPKYSEGARTELQPLTRAKMLMQLAESTFAFPDDAARNLDVLSRVLAGCECYQLVIGDLAEAVTAIDGLVDACLSGTAA